MMDHFFAEIPGFFHFEHGYRRILDSLPLDRPSQFVEIGSFCGKSTTFFAVEVINRQIPVTIHAVDSFVSWEGQAAGEDLKAAFLSYTEPVRAILGDRFQLWAMPSIEAAERFADRTLDAVWVDGDHSYEGCKADILAWWPKLKVGGIMGGDDFMMQPVAQAVVEQFAPNYLCGHGESKVNDVQGPWLWWLVRKDDL